ncbi:MAG: amino acid ABC transporter substrate-binding protein [Pontiellaceae bacterium]|nr:amino acid ABC transporter substrate-binding protein [Pontiellaceae bacterium]
MDQQPQTKPKRKKRRLGFHGTVGLIVLSLLVYLIQQTLIRRSQENIEDRRNAACEKEGAPIKLAFVFPEDYKEQFLAGAELAVDLANAEAEKNPKYRKITWEYFPEPAPPQSVMDVATKISKNPSFFGAVGYYHSQNAMEASTVFEQNSVITMISSANSSRVIALDFEHVFSSSHSTEKTGNHVLPSLSRILSPDHFADNQRPIRLAIIQQPSIYSEDVAISLYSDISRNNDVFNFLNICKKYPTLTLKQLLEDEKISHRQFATITNHLNESAEETGTEIPLSASEIAAQVSDSIIRVDAVLDITYTTENTPPFAVATELAATKPDVIFFATGTTALPLIVQLRKLNENVPILAAAAFDNPGELEPYSDYLTNFYVISSYDDDIQGKALKDVAEQAEKMNPAKYSNFEPDHIKTEAYQAVELLIQACRIYPEYYPEAIAPTLRYAHPQGWSVLNQTLTVSPNQNFDNNLPMFLKKYENGQLVHVPEKLEE